MPVLYYEQKEGGSGVRGRGRGGRTFDFFGIGGEEGGQGPLSLLFSSLCRHVGRYRRGEKGLTMEEEGKDTTYI